MKKIPKNLTILIHIFIYFYHAYFLHCHLLLPSQEHPLISCLTHHKLTNFSTDKASTFHHFLTFSLQDLRVNKTRHPVVIILPETKHQLITSVHCCRTSFIDITIRGGGHSYEGLSSRPRGGNPFAIIDLMNLNVVRVDVESETAWVEGGATLGELYTAVAEKSGNSLGFSAGVGPTVGVSGHFAGGGIGVISRMYGLAADNVVDVVLIDAEGRSLGRDEMDEDVFWALRGGGGGNFGVVYSWKVQLAKVPGSVTGFMVTDPRTSNHRQLAKLLYDWQLIAPNLPDEFHLAAYLSSGENSQVYVKYVLCHLGPKSEAMAIKKERFPELEIDEEEYKEMSWIESVLYYSGLPTGSTINDLKSRYFTGKSCVKIKSDYVRRPVSVEGLEGVINMLGLEPKGQVILDPYGGVMDRIESDAIAFPHRKGNLYNILYVAFWDEDEDEERYMRWLRGIYEYMTPFVSSDPRAAYINYVDLDLGTIDSSDLKQIDWGRKYFLNNYDRLVKAKTIIDPNNVFSHLQGISPANVPTHYEI